MEKIYHDINLDFAENRSLRVIRIKQKDLFGRRLRVSFSFSGQALHLDPDTDTVTLYASIGGIATAVGDNCEIVDNRAIVHITSAMTKLSGTEHCELRIEGINGRVHTATFDMLVEPSTVTEDTPLIVGTADIFGKIASMETDLYSTFTNFTKDLHKDYGCETITINPQSVIEEYVFSAELYHNSLTVWKNGSLLKCGVDYELIDLTYNYLIRFREPLALGDKCIMQLWNIPTSNTTHTTGTAYTSIGSLITDSIVGTIEEDNDE